MTTSQRRRDRPPRLAPDPFAAPDATELLQAPGPLRLLMEARAPWEWAALWASTPWLAQLPVGDGHPVLVFPGLGASDLTTAPLRRFLRSRGYTPYAWEQGLNFGPRHGVLDRCRALLQTTVRRHREPVSLLGWSLGGLYARELAKEQAEHTRCVITLGTPFAGHPRATNAWRLYELVSGQATHDEALLAQLREAPPCPTTSIYSRSDGIVAWQCSVQDGHAQVENIEVPASHIGMGVNPLVLAAVADRLAQHPARWQPFEPQGAQRWFYKVLPQAPRA